MSSFRVYVSKKRKEKKRIQPTDTTGPNDSRPDVHPKIQRPKKIPDTYKGLIVKTHIVIDLLVLIVYTYFNGLN